ncbi:BlaI/MecI/CopY family transcriptional regulator [Pseudoflavonifractor sp. BIOML-A14]|nr:BlaI/MecI/CopY family transcriptional regulator [Pseudoflavonifractor sp. BIOML-A14]
MEDYKLYDAEYRLMDLIWSLEPVNSTALSKLCLERFGWKKPTTYNLLRKLGERGFLRNEAATVTALAKREQVRQYESEAVVEKSFGGSLPAFVAAFLRGRRLSADEARALRQMIEEAGDE